jgi:sigma-B regulation protein RsbU (phosphoserine phosphatase)
VIKILIVDDEPDVELLMKQRFRRQLKENEFTLFFAHNGIEALEILSKDPGIRIVISDINMPEMDGLTLLDNIQKEYPDVMAIIVSAYGDMNNIRTAMNRGAFDFVTKPINFDDLTTTINKTLDHLQQLLTAEKTKNKLESILFELNVANDIQQSILPKEFIDNNVLQLHAKMRPAKEVGGDFYDFFWITPEEIALVIADVSGKGVPAALFMTVSRTLIRAHATEKISPAKCLEIVNRLLEKSNSNNMFVTTFYGILNTKSGCFNYANAGHNPPILISSAQTSFLPTTKGMALGIVPLDHFEENTIQLKKNDLLYLYTDGVTEAMSREEKCFGEQALQNVLQNSPGLGARQTIEKVEEELKEFTLDAEQSDDITMLAIRYLGS